jgi:hypothetical protein
MKNYLLKHPLNCLLGIILFLGFQTKAQENKNVKFIETVHDFGDLKEEVGQATHEFKFKNAGTTPIKLTDVKASCGCTTPDWTKDNVTPGKDGIVKATYSTTNRPGPFTKTITVKAQPENGQEEVHILTIKGNVIPRPKGIQDWYPTVLGSIRASSNHVAFGKTYNDEKKEQKLVFYNESEKPIQILSYDLPSHISATSNKKSINPKDSAFINITFDANKIDDWGFLHTQIKIKTDDENTPEKVIYISADRQENFDKLTQEQKDNGPRITFDKVTHDFGTIKAGKKVDTEYVFKNTGKSELIIRKTKASCGCTATQPEKTRLKPGESSKIKATYDSTGKKGNENKTITVISNDPTNPSIVLTIKGVVEDDSSTQPTSK